MKHSQSIHLWGQRPLNEPDRLFEVHPHVRQCQQYALESETKEINVINTFLPKQLSEEETKKICSEIITKVGAQTIKDMGKVMGELKKNYSDSIDFSKAGPMLKELLNKK